MSDATQQQQAVDQWNMKYPVGTPVTLINELGIETHTVTTSPAMLFAKSESVVYVRGKFGTFNLNRLIVSEPQND